MISNRHPAVDRPQLPAGLYRLVMWTIEAGQALFFDPEKDFASPEDLYYNEVGRALLVPLTSGEAPLGAILAMAPAHDSNFDESDMVVTRTMANAAATVIRLTALAMAKHGRIITLLRDNHQRAWVILRAVKPGAPAVPFRPGPVKQPFGVGIGHVQTAMALGFAKIVVPIGAVKTVLLVEILHPFHIGQTVIIGALTTGHRL